MPARRQHGAVTFIVLILSFRGQQAMHRPLHRDRPHRALLDYRGRDCRRPAYPSCSPVCRSPHLLRDYAGVPPKTSATFGPNVAAELRDYSHASFACWRG